MDKKTIALIAGAVVIVALIILGVVFGWYRFLLPNDLQKGWVYKHSKLCNIDVPLPPRKGEYAGSQGEYWRFEENAMTQGNPFFPNIAVAIFQNPDAGGSGYIAGSVIVSCQPNTTHDSTEILADKYAQYLIGMNKDASAEAKVTFTQLGTEKVWGEDALVISMKGGIFNPADHFYLLATPKTNYLIAKIHMSTDQTLVQTSEEIFSKLKFR
jgi:hypothetical protein